MNFNEIVSKMADIVNSTVEFIKIVWAQQNAPEMLGAALAALVLFYRHTSPRDVLTRCGLALMISGALGNLIDRICFQYVRDFLHFNFFGYDFPVFNIADSVLCIGVFLIIVAFMLEERRGGRA